VSAVHAVARAALWQGRGACHGVPKWHRHLRQKPKRQAWTG